MFCTACATFNPATGRCIGCGTDLGGRPSTPTPQSSVLSPQPSALMRRLTTSLYAVPVLVLLLVGAGYYRTEWREPAASYARAETAVAAGRFADAADAFAAARGYRDAEVRLADVTAFLAPYRAAYLDAAVALDAGRPDEAVALLSSVVRDLPSFEDAAALLGEARERQLAALAEEADTAAAGGDWLAAERALAAVVAARPGDEALAARLAMLRRDHAPLAFARDQALYLVGPDGEEERLLIDAVPVAWPVWSPDRARLAFTSLDPTGAEGIRLFVANADGSALRLLARGLRPYVPPLWSPDGAKIAYSIESKPMGPPDGGAIRIVDVGTGQETELAAVGNGEAVYPSWSPTGDRLAFVAENPADPYAGLASPGRLVSFNEVYVVRLATGEVTNISRGRIAYPWRVTWSPVDERVLVYTRAPGAARDRDQARIALIDASTGALADVDTDGRVVTMPVWSPDGERVAFVAGESTVLVQDVTEGDSALITLHDPISRFLAWSPDGGALVAAAANPGDDSAVISFADGAMEAARTLPLAYDVDRRQSGAPQWAPLNPPVVPTPPTVAGTALDPAG